LVLSIEDEPDEWYPHFSVRIYLKDLGWVCTVSIPRPTYLQLARGELLELVTEAVCPHRDFIVMKEIPKQ